MRRNDSEGKRNPRRWLAAVVCIVCMVMVSCGKPDDKNEDIGALRSGTTELRGGTPSEVHCDGRIVFFRDDATYTEDYVLFSNSDMGIWYFDVTTGQSGRYCFDPTCEHKHAVYSPDGKTLLEEGCFSHELASWPFPCGEYIYYYHYGPSYLARTDRTGNNREILWEPQRPYGPPACIYFTDEAVYIAYQNSYEYKLVEGSNGETVWVSGNLKEKLEVGVVRVPYSGGKEEVIFRSDEYYNMGIYEFEYYNGKLRFLIGGMDRPANNDIDLMQDPEVWQPLVEEERQHTLTIAYEYTITTGAIRKIFELKPYTGSYFLQESYCTVDGDFKLSLYSYDGAKLWEAANPMDVVVSDHGLIAVDMKSNQYSLLDEKTGAVLKTSPFTWDDFRMDVVVGDSFYGHVGMQRGYISAEDFWAGDRDGIVCYPDDQ
ncbi:MAG: hypothetical protein IKI15_00205 [Lachnospiraceae bacterium]|nr:hypothetical protein [Lachnospiraceae bacterium]